ncbi:MMPL family transporter [Butyrivibrio sp. MC2021]|uniref:MMPL family transporter n=1 Tax=Butyrivibrio sp. MC2021 TaxID=1408306 RepID=UPI00047DE899|nr:MMPL family transporter [Butyrivibrio sp. MC2021]
MANKQGNAGNSFMLKICGFIVDKRNLFFLIYAILCIFSVIANGWVKVENDLAYYLPSDCETRQGLDLMEEEFTTYGSVKTMVANISYDQALMIQKDIQNIEGVFSCEVDDSSDHYANGSALFNITFDYDENDEECLVSLAQVREYFTDYDSYESTTLGDIQPELIAKEMDVISVIVVFIVVGVLLLTSQAYAEVPVLLLTFGSAALVQMGTNFLFGTISFVSNSVTIVLQLALSVDYAVIFLNRFKEERQKMEAREACIVSLSKAIPEISGSSLTTMGGLIAMLFMQFGIGKDLGIVLIKAILLSLLSVFLLMPGIIMLFADLMEKTKHKNFIPQIPFVGKFAYATRYIVAPAFVVAIIIAQRLSSGTPYVYGYSQITPPLINDVQKAQNLQNENFYSDNMMALVFPSGDYEREKRLIDDLENNQHVTSVTGLANAEAIGGYTLTDKLTPRQFSELLDVDYEVAELVYAAYAVNDSDYAKVVNGLANYKVPLIEMFMFVYQEVEEGYVTLDDSLMEKLNDADRMMNFAKKQLQGENYSRVLVYVDLPQESEETFDFIQELHRITEKYYDEDKIYVVGESVSQYDLKKCFARDNTVTSVISILAVLIVLLFTFKSAGMPVLLIAVIQGCIWINFSFPAIQHDNLFFLGYLIVSSIQMGANIDYAIVIAGRYTELRSTRGKKEAIIDTMNLSFPTIITSGTMLAVAGTLIGNMTSDCAIYGIGKCLGRGTIISIFVTMFVLPQILLVGDKVIELTAFVMNMPIQTKQISGAMRIDGMVRGRIEGTVNGIVHATVRGNVSAFIDNGEVHKLDESEEELETGTDMTSREGV